MNDTRAFVEGLALAFPSLREPLREHREDNFGELLPHLAMADFGRAMVELHERGGRAGEHEVIRFLEAVDRALADAGPAVDEVIVLSFLELLPSPGERGAGIRKLLPPRLRAALAEIEAP